MSHFGCFSGHDLSKTKSVTPHFFYISDITNSSSYSGKSFRKKSMLKKFRANVLKSFGKGGMVHSVTLFKMIVLVALLLSHWKTMLLKRKETNFIQVSSRSSDGALIGNTVN